MYVRGKLFTPTPVIITPTIAFCISVKWLVLVVIQISSGATASYFKVDLWVFFGRKRTACPSAFIYQSWAYVTELSYDSRNEYNLWPWFTSDGIVASHLSLRASLSTLLASSCGCSCVHVCSPLYPVTSQWVDCHPEFKLVIREHSECVIPHLPLKCQSHLTGT